MDDKSFLTSIEVADLLQVHQTTVIRWMDTGKLPGYKTPGGHRRFRPAEVRGFMQEHRMPGWKDVGELSSLEAEAPEIRVLFVDDQPRIVRSFIRYFRSSKVLRVAGATSGAEALIQVAREVPHVVVLDLAMPGVDGFEFIRAMKSDSTLADVSVVVLSGELSARTRTDLEALGVEVALEKPAPPNLVQDAILGEVLPKLLRPIANRQS